MRARRARFILGSASLGFLLAGCAAVLGLEDRPYEPRTDASDDDGSISPNDATATPDADSGAGDGSSTDGSSGCLAGEVLFQFVGSGGNAHQYHLDAAAITGFGVGTPFARLVRDGGPYPTFRVANVRNPLNGDVLVSRDAGEVLDGSVVGELGLMFDVDASAPPGSIRIARAVSATSFHGFFVLDGSAGIPAGWTDDVEEFRVCPLGP